MVLSSRVGGIVALGASNALGRLPSRFLRAVGASALAFAIVSTPSALPAAHKPEPTVSRKIKVDPLQITRDAELRFGKMVVTAVTGKVIVPADGLTTYQNTVRVGGTTGPARLTFTGTPNRMIEVQVTAPILSKIMPDGRVELESLDVEPLTNQGVSKYPGAVRMRLDASGSVGLLIGGTLIVSPNSSVGIATIPIPVSASYINE